MPCEETEPHGTWNGKDVVFPKDAQPFDASAPPDVDVCLLR